MAGSEHFGRASLIRGTLLYSVFLALDIAVIVLILIVRTGNAAFITLAFVAFVGILLVFQVVQHVRDLRAPLTETDGVVIRKWRRADLIIAMDSYYLTVGKKVFRVRPEDWVHIDEMMRVRVIHYPHTLNVVSVQEVYHRPGSGDGAGGGP
jgi:hypothetical protein